MKKVLILSGIAAAVGLAWYFWPSDKKAAGARTETKRIRVERGDITLIVAATGEIKPVREVELKSKASGQVVRFKKNPGDPVEEGELIAELDKKTEQRNLAREQANLSRAEAQLELTRLEYVASLKQAESELAAAQEDEKQKKAELGRVERLTDGLVSESELGNARLAARLAEEKARQAHTALGLIRSRKEADEKLAASEVQKSQVAVEDAQERLRDTELRAPMKGILLKKLVEEGQIVASGISASTGGTPIAVVADVSRLFVEANVDESDISKVRKDQAAEIALLGTNNDRFQGRVELILPKGELDSNVIIFKVRVTIEGDAFGRAYPGMTASVNLTVNERKGTLLVPSEAIRMIKGKPVVEVPDGPASRQLAVKIGIDNGVKTEILEGVDETSEILVTRTVGEYQRSRTGFGLR